MDCGGRRKDILLIGTTKGAKSWLHHLAHEPPQHKPAWMNKADGQLEFQSTGDPVPAALGERTIGDGRRIAGDAGHWPSEVGAAVGAGAVEKATGAGL